MTTTISQAISSEQFTWDGSTGTACASDLGFRAGETPRLLRIESAKTGETLVFWYWSAEVSEGDLLYTTFLSTTCGKHVQVQIFND